MEPIHLKNWQKLAVIILIALIFALLINGCTKARYPEGYTPPEPTAQELVDAKKFGKPVQVGRFTGYEYKGVVILDRYVSEF